MPVSNNPTNTASPRLKTLQRSSTSPLSPSVASSSAGEGDRDSMDGPAQVQQRTMASNSKSSDSIPTTSTPPRPSTLGFRRSIDFGSTLFGSNGHSRSSTMGSNSASNAGSRFGTVSGLPGLQQSSVSSSTLGNLNGSGSNKRARSSFGMGGGGLAALFSGTARSNNSAGSDLVEEPGERDLMQAVEAAKADDGAWEIVVQEAKRDALFLESSSSTTSPTTGTSYTRRIANTARMLSPRNGARKGGSGSNTPTMASKGTRRSESATVPAEDTDASSPLFVLYVTTGTSSLTLYRTAARLVQLDQELRSLHPDSLPAEKPSVLSTLAAASPAAVTSSPPSPQPGNARRRSVLATLTRTFAGSSKRASPAERPMSPTAESGSSQVVFNDSNAAVNEVTATDKPVAPQLLASQLSNLSDYLSSLSTVVLLRQSQPWTTFFRPGKEDHSSAHLEKREPKRIKSEISLSHSSLSPLKTTRATADMKEQVVARAANPDDSGIGDLSLYQSTNMRREASTATSNSAMSLFVENVPDNITEGGRAVTPSGVADPEVLAFMHSIIEEPGSATRVDESGAGSDEKVEQESVDGTATAPARPILESVDTATANEPILAALEESAIEEEEDQIPLTASTAVGTVSDYAAAQTQLLDSEAENDAGEEEGRAGLPEDSVDETAAARIEEELEAHMSKIEQEVEARRAGSADLQHSTVEVEERAMLSPASASRVADASMKRRRVASSAKSSSRGKRAVGIEDFEVVRVLGKGCAGKVLLARSKDSTTLYAIKAIHKHHVLAHRELAHTLTEQSILKKMATQYDNPFVVKMSFSFQNKDNLFLVLDFHPGGDLATQLSRWGRLGKDRTRFYAAEIVQGVEGLHSAGVIYRDLKPENILLAADGHIILTDFGLSKQFLRSDSLKENGEGKAPSPPWMKDSTVRSSAALGTMDQDESTSTFCGTAEYLAPEVLLGNAYSYPVDMWSLGTMIYEMLLGVTPFYNEDHGIMYRRVLHETLSFGSSDYLDGDTRALLRGLLQKEPEFRMTTKRVKKSKYFEAIDWEFVQHKRYIPPFVPALSAEDPEDTQNFDDCFLTMDLGFIDDDDEGDNEKVRNSGKEPDKPFDEQGRDVFEGYGFSGKVAEEDDEDVEEEEPEQEREQQAQLESASHISERRVESSDSADSSPSFDDNTGRFKNDTDDQDDYDTGLTSASVTDDGYSKHTKDTSSHLRVLSSGLASLAEDADVQQESPTSMQSEHYSKAVQGKEEESEEPESVSPRLSLEYAPRKPAEQARRSVEMPRQQSEAEREPRRSEEGDDWDVVETMTGEEFAQNGGRKRLIAGPTLFAKGVVDKYRLQLKPLTRAPTPTRSYTSRTALNRLASRQSSNTNVNQLSPSPSVGGISKPPSVEQSPTPSTKEGQKQRYRAPKLLRASTEWMSSSLPSSPSPGRFRIKGSKKSVNPVMHAKGSNMTVESLRAVTPVSVDSNATLPLEASSATLPPLTRQGTREQPEGEEGEERETESPQEMSANETEKQEEEIKPKITKIKRFTLDPTKMSGLFTTKSATSTSS